MLEKLNGLGRWGRLGLVGSAVWVLVSLVGSFGAAYTPATSGRFAEPATFDFAEFLVGWIVIGILPVLLVWGIAWALSAKAR